jgi:hypothetical protein
LIARYGERRTILQSHPGQPTQPLAVAAAKTLLQPICLAISRTISHDCSLAGAKWSSLAIIDRFEGCHRCRFTISFEEEASNFSAPKAAVQRYLSSSFLTTSFRYCDCATTAILVVIATRPTPVRRSSESTLQSGPASVARYAGVRAQREMRSVLWLHRARDVLTSVWDSSNQARAALLLRVTGNNDTPELQVLCGALHHHDTKGANQRSSFPSTAGSSLPYHLRRQSLSRDEVPYSR